MADSAKLDLVHKAICSGIMGHIQWKDAAADLLRDNPEMRAFNTRSIRELLRQFVMNGQCLEARPEIRAEWLEAHPDDPFWYRAIIPVPGLKDGLFVEVRLFDCDPDEPWVEIVSAHPQRST